MNLGKDLRDFRKNNKWTQKQIAEKLGIPSTTWASWENNQSQPKVEILCILRQMGLEITGLTTNESPIAPQEVIDIRLKELSEQKKTAPEETAVEPKLAPSEEKRRANTSAAITMLENAAQSIQAAVQLLKESLDK